MTIQELPKNGQIWKHIKNGDYYHVVGIANSEATDPHTWPIKVVYVPIMADIGVNRRTVDVRNTIWSRDPQEFLEKFERQDELEAIWIEKGKGREFEIVSVELQKSGELFVMLMLVNPEQKGTYTLTYRSMDELKKKYDRKAGT